MEKSTEIHRPYGQGLGDCWLVLSFLINLAKERNQIFRLSRWYAKGQWKKWAMKFNELLPLLRDNHLVELGDWEATEPKIPWQKLGEYPSAKACMIWTPNNSKKICYQFDGQSRHRQNFPSKEVEEELLRNLQDGGYELVRLGGHKTIKQCIEELSACELFVGVDSGFGHIASSVGTPTFYSQNGRGDVDWEIFYSHRDFVLAKDYLGVIFHVNNYKRLGIGYYSENKYRKRTTMNPLTRATYGEVIRKDCYKMNDFPNNYFNAIVDIGANVGVFVLYAHMRHPRAKIFAYEPCKESNKTLIDNTWYLDNVVCVNEALGNGQPLFLHNTGYSPCNLFFEKDDVRTFTEIAGTYPIPSCSLSQIFKRCKIEGKYCIKLDCEGGERFLLTDEECIGIIRNADLFAMEVHFPPVRQHNNMIYERFKTFPSWHTFNDWVQKHFKQSHKIIYHMSDRKKRGTGIYVLTKK